MEAPILSILHRCHQYIKQTIPLLKIMIVLFIRCFDVLNEYYGFICLFCFVCLVTYIIIFVNCWLTDCVQVQVLTVGLVCWLGGKVFRCTIRLSCCRGLMTSLLRIRYNDAFQTFCIIIFQKENGTFTSMFLFLPLHILQL